MSRRSIDKNVATANIVVKRRPLSLKAWGYVSTAFERTSPMFCPLLRKPIEILEVHSISPSNHPGTKKGLNVNFVLTDAGSHQTPRAITILCLLTA